MVRFMMGKTPHHISVYINPETALTQERTNYLLDCIHSQRTGQCLIKPSLFTTTHNLFVDVAGAGNHYGSVIIIIILVEEVVLFEYI